MGVEFGTTEMTKMYFGSNQISSVYFVTTKVFGGSSFTPLYVALTTGTSYTVPTGATSMKAWVVGPGSSGYQIGFTTYSGSAGGVAYKTYTVSGGNSITYSIGVRDSSNTTLTYGGVTITGNRGNQGTGGSFSGGDGGATGGTGGNTPSYPYAGIGGSINCSVDAYGGSGPYGNETCFVSSSCYRGDPADVDGLFSAASSAGLNVTEGCVDTNPPLGAGAAYAKDYSAKRAGYGGGGCGPASLYGGVAPYTYGGGGVIVLAFT